jgi:hypothetical protein
MRPQTAVSAGGVFRNNGKEGEILCSVSVLVVWKMVKESWNPGCT